jgi:hypothetical protein
MVTALIDEADPLNVLRRYRALAAAGKEILRTDVPRELMPAFVDLALDAKKKVRSIAFVSSDHFSSADPDFAWMRSVVAEALAPRQPSRNGAAGARASVRTEGVCGYHPTG